MDDEMTSGGIHRTEEGRMQLRLLRSAAQVPADATVRPLDRKSLDRWVSKMGAAMESNAEKALSRGETFKGGKKKKKKEVLSAAAINALEHKLYLAIRGEYRNRMAIMLKRKQAVLSQTQRAMTPAESQEEHERRMDTATSVLGTHTVLGVEIAFIVSFCVRLGSIAAAGSPDSPPPTLSQELVRVDSNDEHFDDDNYPQTSAPSTAPTTASAPSPASPTSKRGSQLTTRMLLPYYKLESVHQFMDIFAKVNLECC